MKKENLQQFLNQKIKLLIDVGEGKTFRYVGTLSRVDGDDIVLDDRMKGEMIFSINHIVGVVREAGRP